MIKSYREHLQMIPAVQYDGTNIAELEEFAPGLIHVTNGNVTISCGSWEPLPVNVTDWLIDDPGIGYIVPITDLAWQCRFTP